MSVLHIDATALIRRHLDGPFRTFVNDTMRTADHWTTSALTTTECRLMIQAAQLPTTERARVIGAIMLDIEAMWVVPVDGRCLARATELGATYGLGTIDAIHLAAADRLPRPAELLTFDRRQIPTATALNLGLRSPVDG